MNATAAPAPHQPHWISRHAFQVVSVLFFATQAVLGIAAHLGCDSLAYLSMAGVYEAVRGSADRLDDRA